MIEQIEKLLERYLRITPEQSRKGLKRAGIALAAETIAALSKLEGLRGFELRGGGDEGAVLAVIEEAGLKTD